MTGHPEANGRVRCDGRLGVESSHLHKRQHLLNVVDVVQGTWVRMLAEAMFAGKRSVLLLQLGAVPQDDLRQCGRAWGAEDGSAKSLGHQSRQVTAVIKMGVTQDDGVEFSYRNSCGVPVAEPEGLQALKEPAIEQHGGSVAVEQEPATCHCPRCA